MVEIILLVQRFPSQHVPFLLSLLSFLFSIPRPGEKSSK